jgi:1,2-phenylacetyl-CoA epoxidase catalytic subunit
MATISKGIKLSYKTTGDTYTALTKLQSLPDLGGDTEAIEITTFDDAAHMYENGIKNYGDTLSFTFLYDATQFSTLNALAG